MNHYEYHDPTNIGSGSIKIATTFLKKLNITINILEQDDKNAAKTMEDNIKDLNSQVERSTPVDEVYVRIEQNMKKHFNEKGENIHLQIATENEDILQITCPITFCHYRFCI